MLLHLNLVYLTHTKKFIFYTKVVSSRPPFLCLGTFYQARPLCRLMHLFSSRGWTSF